MKNCEQNFKVVVLFLAFLMPPLLNARVNADGSGGLVVPSSDLTIGRPIISLTPAGEAGLTGPIQVVERQNTPRLLAPAGRAWIETEPNKWILVRTEYDGATAPSYAAPNTRWVQDSAGGWKLVNTRMGTPIVGVVKNQIISQRATSDLAGQSAADRRPPQVGRRDQITWDEPEQDGPPYPAPEGQRWQKVGDRYILMDIPVSDGLDTYTEDFASPAEEVDPTTRTFLGRPNFDPPEGMEWYEGPAGWVARTKRYAPEGYSPDGEFADTPAVVIENDSPDAADVGEGDYGGDYSKPTIIPPKVELTDRTEVEGQYFNSRPNFDPPPGMEWINTPAGWTVQTKSGYVPEGYSPDGEFAGAPDPDQYMPDPTGEGEFGGAPITDQMIMETTGAGEFTTNDLSDEERAALLEQQAERRERERREAAASVFYQSEPNQDPPEGMKWVETPNGWVAQSIPAAELADIERREAAASVFYPSKPTGDAPEGMMWVETPRGWVAQSMTEEEIALRGENPPYEPGVGNVWFRPEGSDVWELMTEDEYLEMKREAIKDANNEVFGQRLPVRKSIQVLNLDNGRTKTLHAGRYSFQVVGRAPRGNIRVKVFDREGEEVPGDWITIEWNVRNGTNAESAAQSLDLLDQLDAVDGLIDACRARQADIVYPGGSPDGSFTSGPTISPAADPREGEGGPIDHGQAEGYKPGCEALADGVSARDKEKLRQCVSSILDFIKEGSRNRCESIEKMFSLKHDEQNFIGAMFTTKGEAPGINEDGVTLPGGSPDHLMIMKSLENRANAAIERHGITRQLSILDIALQPQQYSMYWDWDRDGQFDGRGFLSDDRGYDRLVDSYIAYQDADWQPPGEIDRVTHYYSPPGMVPKNSEPSWVRRPRPTLNEITSEIRVNGEPVVRGNARALDSGYHKFYVGVDGPDSYNANPMSRSRILSTCRERSRVE